MHYLFIVVFPALVAYAAVSDFLTMTISNRLTLALLAGFLVLAPFSAMTWPGFGWPIGGGWALGNFGWALLGAGLVLAIGFGCFAAGWVGGGDVKFATVVALWLGWDHLLEYAVLFSLYGGLLTIAVLSLSKLIEPLPILQVGFLNRFHQHRRVPYGIALAAAALQVFPETVWLKIAA